MKKDNLPDGGDLQSWVLVHNSLHNHIPPHGWICTENQNKNKDAIYLQIQPNHNFPGVDNCRMIINYSEELNTRIIHKLNSYYFIQMKKMLFRYHSKSEPYHDWTHILPLKHRTCLVFMSLVSPVVTVNK